MGLWTGTQLMEIRHAIHGNTCAEESEEDVEKDVLYINSYIQAPNQSALNCRARSCLRVVPWLQ